MADSSNIELDSTSSIPLQHEDVDTEVFSCETVCCIEHEQPEQNISTDTIFTVIVTLSIFIIGIAIDRFLKWLDGYRKRYKLRSYFEYHLIKVNDGLIPKLRDGYRKFYQITNIDSGITSTPPKVLSSDFERLQHINSSDLFHVYKNKEVFSKVLSQIDFVSRIQNEVDNFHALVLDQSGKLREELKTLSDEYISLLAEYGEMEKSNQDATYQLFNDSVLFYYRELAGKRRLTDFYKKIIRPVQENLINSGIYRSHPKAKEIAEKGRKISHVYNELRHRNVEVRIQYRTFSRYMDDALNSLSDLLTKLN